MPVSKPPKPPVRAKRTKAEVAGEIRRDPGRGGNPRATQLTPSGRRRHACAKPKPGPPVDGVTVEGVGAAVSAGLGLEVSKALAELSGKLVQEVNLLGSVRETVELERLRNWRQAA